MINKTKAPVGATLVIVSAFFYASYGIWTKLMGNSFGGYSASALRSVLVLVILLPIAIYYKTFQPIKWSENWLYVSGMIIASLLTWGPLYYAILHDGVGIALTIAYAGIVIGMFFFGWIIAKESFTKDKLIATILGFIGLALVFQPNISGLGWLGLTAAFVSGIGSSANAVFAKKIQYNATQSTIFLWIASVIANTIMAFVLTDKVPKIGLHLVWLYLLLFAIASVVASWSLVRGVKLIDAGAAGILGLLEIVFGVIFGAVFFSEKYGNLVLLGIVIIVLASAVPYIVEYRLNKLRLSTK